jgi:hypothetical protein
MSYNIGETIFNLVTPSLYGTASVLSYTTAFSLGIGTFFAGEGVKQIVRPVFLKQLNLDVTKDIGNMEDFMKEHGGFIDTLFERFDADHNGEISQEEFKEGLIDFFDEILDCVYGSINGLGWGKIQTLDETHRSYIRKEIVLGLYSFDDPENPEEDKPGIKEEMEEDFNQMYEPLWKIFDINHDEKITKDECVKGMYSVLNTLHNYLDAFEKGLFAFKAMGATMFLLGGFCAYKHVSNSISTSD